MDCSIEEVAGWHCVFDTDHRLLVAFKYSFFLVNKPTFGRLFLYTNAISIEYGDNRVVSVPNELYVSLEKFFGVAYARIGEDKIYAFPREQFVPREEYVPLGEISSTRLYENKQTFRANSRKEKKPHEVLPGQVSEDEAEVFQDFFTIGRKMITAKIKAMRPKLDDDDLSEMSVYLMEFGDRIQTGLPTIYANIAREHPKFLNLFSSHLDSELEKLRSAIDAIDSAPSSPEPEEIDMASIEAEVLKLQKRSSLRKNKITSI